MVDMQSMPPESSISPRRQILFAQRKLKEIYDKTCVRLDPYRDVVETVQEVVLWRKPSFTGPLYIFVHFIFWYSYNLEQTTLVFLSNTVFWLLVVDLLWVIATRDRDPGDDVGSRQRARQDGGNNTRSAWATRVLFIRKNRRRAKAMPMEQAIMAAETPLEVGQLAPFEVICIHVAKAIMWADNVQLALKHWNLEQPFLFGLITGALGICCIVIGYIFPFLLLAYITVMGLLLWPAIVYYDLLTTAQDIVQSHSPWLVERASRMYKSIRAFVTPLPEEEFAAVQLPKDSPLSTSNLLSPTTDSDVSQGSNGSGNSSGIEVAAIPEEYEIAEEIHVPTAPVDPSMTLPPFDPHINPMDSLASFVPSQDGFQSITSYFREDSLTLPSFPASMKQPQMAAAHSPPMATVDEEYEDISLEDIKPQIERPTETYGTMDTNSYSSSDNLSFPPSDPPPPYDEEHEKTSPYFSKSFVTPSMGPVDSSTPVTDNGTLRHR